MWQAVKWFGEKGFSSFNFGRTEPENTGLLQFKRGWRPVEEKIPYYKYDYKQSAFITTGPNLKTSYSLFHHLPLPALKLLGTLLYRHVG